MRQPVSAFGDIHHLFYKSYLPNIVNVAIDAGVFEALSAKAMSAASLSEKLKTDQVITQALLEVLTAADYLHKKYTQYELTLIAKEYLTEASELNQLRLIKRYAVDAGPFKNLLTALKGDIEEFEQKQWSNEEAIIEIEQGAKAGAIQDMIAFAEKMPEFHTATKMCDLAGNSGYYAFASLNENPNLMAHVYDLEAVCEIAKKIKKQEPNFNRITYHACDIQNDSFGNDYDLFFISHFLYKYAATNQLVDVLKKVNRSMKMGGLFISQHMTNDYDLDCSLTLTIVELMTCSMGYPTHFLPENTFKEALNQAGFGQFKVQAPDERLAYPSFLLKAIKEREI